MALEQLNFSGEGSLPLDFENDTYLAFASDMCSPTVGTNNILFAVSKAQQIQATIAHPSGATVANYSGYVPYPATVDLPWNFTEADGTTPYTDDTYVVTFTALDPTTLVITNTIDREGVRTAAGNILTYEQEDPTTSTGSILDSDANTWIGTLALGLYSALYSTDFGSVTQYSPYDIGANRDNPSWTSFPLVLSKNNQTNWAVQTFYSITNPVFSDFGFYMGHGNGTGIGGGPNGPSSYIPGWISSGEVKYYAKNFAFPKWRFRKVVLWACYTDSPGPSTAGGTIPTWSNAFGIRSTRLQRSSFMQKNVGLFFAGQLPQAGYSGTLGNGTSPEVAANFDALWVEGPNPAPGSCDPTYAFGWAFVQIQNMSPEINLGYPVWRGFGYLPYTGIYDSQLVTNIPSNIKWP